MLGDYETDSVLDCVRKNMCNLFPCHSPLKPYVRTSDARIQTFSKNWPMKDHATPCEMADAGFYYLDDSDRVVCFFEELGSECKLLVQACKVVPYV